MTGRHRRFCVAVLVLVVPEVEILLFYNFARSNVGPKEVPEGKMVFSLQRGAHKFRKVHGVVMRSTFWGRRAVTREGVAQSTSAGQGEVFIHKK